MNGGLADYPQKTAAPVIRHPASGIRPPLTIRPPPTVIPAKAGIHTPTADTPGRTGVLDSGLRRNDGEGAGMMVGRVRPADWQPPFTLSLAPGER